MKKFLYGVALFLLSNITINFTAAQAQLTFDDLEFDIVREGSERWGVAEVTDGAFTLMPCTSGSEPSTRLQYETAVECLLKYNLLYQDTDREFRAVSFERIRVDFNKATAQQIWTGGEPSAPGEGGDSPPAGWSESVICDGTPANETPCTGGTHPVTADSHTYTTTGGLFDVTSEGGRLITTTDSFVSWMYTTDTTSDYTITARINAASSTDKERTGLMIRDGTADDDTSDTIHVNAANGLYRIQRATDGASNNQTILDATAVSLPICLRYEVDRAESSIKAFRSDGCSSYTEQYQIIGSWVDSGNTFYFHLFTTPSDVDNEGIVSAGQFDSVVVDTSNVDHGGAGSSNVDFDDSSPTQSEETTPLTFSITRSGSGSGACNIDADTSDGTATAGTDYTTTHCDLDWTDGQTTTKTCDVPIIDRDGVVQGNRTFDLDLTADSCTDTIVTASATATILDQDSSGASFTADTESYDSILTDHACWGCDWESYLDTNPDYEVVEITNTNVSGAGSLQQCMTQSSSALRICVPTISGKIDAPRNQTFFTTTRDNVIYLGAAAPSPGLHWESGPINIRGTRQLWLHGSCFHDGDPQGSSFPGATQSTGRCWNINDDGMQDVVIINWGDYFGRDGGSTQVWDTNSNGRVTLMRGIKAYTLARREEDLTAGKFCANLANANNGTRILWRENICAHFIGRGPKLNAGLESVILNSISYNGGQNIWQIGTGGGQSTPTSASNYNVEGNLWIGGPDTGSGVEPVDVGSNTGTGSALFVGHNRAFATGVSDATQDDLINDGSGGVVTISTSTRQGEFPSGASRTDIGAGQQGEEDFAALFCAHFGPYPHPDYRLPHYQMICDQIQATFDGVGDQGSVIDTVGDHPLGYPTVAQNNCDIDSANDCGANKPALPASSTWKDAATGHYNVMFEWISDMHCAVMPAGARGC